MKHPVNRHERKRRAIQRAREAHRQEVFWREPDLRGASADDFWLDDAMGSPDAFREALDRERLRSVLDAAVKAHQKIMGLPRDLLIGKCEWTLSGESLNPDDPGRIYARLADPGPRS